MHTVIRQTGWLRRTCRPLNAARFPAWHGSRNWSRTGPIYRM